MWLGASGVSAETKISGEQATSVRLDTERSWTFIRGVLARGVAALAKRGEPAEVVATFVGALRSAAALMGPARNWPVELRPLPRLDFDPVKGTLSSPFGFRRDPINKRRRKHHNGIDFYAKRGDDVRASGAGIVVKARRYYGYGRVVFIDHGRGLVTRYGHLETIGVKEGEHVPANALIGTVGSSGRATGPHLHFEVRLDDNPIAPSRVMSTTLVPGVPRLFDVLSLLVNTMRSADSPNSSNSSNDKEFQRNERSSI